MVKWITGGYGRSARKRIGKYYIFFRDNPQLGYSLTVTNEKTRERITWRGGDMRVIVENYDAMKTVSDVESYITHVKEFKSKGEQTG